MTVFQEIETVELKKSTSERKEAVISLVAMLNKHQRGEVWFGVINDKTKQNVRQPIRNRDICIEDIHIKLDMLNVLIFVHINGVFTKNEQQY